MQKTNLSIDHSHAKWFREGSVAILTKEGFIGEYYIEILPYIGHSLKAPQIAQKTEKAIEEITELAKSLQKLSKKLNETATTIKSSTKKDIPSIIEQAKKSMQDADEILQSIKGLWPIREGIKKQEIKPVESDSYEP